MAYVNSIEAQRLISHLWDCVQKKGENLQPRRLVLSEVGLMKDKSKKLSELYNRLVALGFAEFNIRYIAKTREEYVQSTPLGLSF